MKKLITILLTTFLICTASYGATIKELLGLDGKKYGKCGYLASNEGYWGRRDFTYIAFDNKYFYTNYDSNKKKFITEIRVKTKAFKESVIQSRSDPTIDTIYTYVTLSPGTNSEKFFRLKLEFDKEFIWDGHNNILISWENRDGSWKSGYGHLRGIDSIDLEDRSHFWFADKSYPTSDSSWDGFRANLKLWARVAGSGQEGRL